MALVVVVLGSNIAAESHLPQGVAALARAGRVLRVSQVYATPPVGTAGPRFLNAAVLWATDQAPPRLVAWLRAVERALGRVRSADPNAPRPIDLDALLYRAAPAAEVQVLNPREWRYAHAVVPAAEVAPHWPVQERPLRLWAAALAAKAASFSPQPHVWAQLVAYTTPAERLSS